MSTVKQYIITIPKNTYLTLVFIITILSLLLERFKKAEGFPLEEIYSAGVILLTLLGLFLLNFPLFSQVFSPINFIPYFVKFFQYIFITKLKVSFYSVCPLFFLIESSQYDIIYKKFKW